MNALQWNRDLLSSVYTIRAQEAHTPGRGRGQNTVALPEMRRGPIALALAALVARSTGQPAPHNYLAPPVPADRDGPGAPGSQHPRQRGGFTPRTRATA